MNKKIKQYLLYIILCLLFSCQSKMDNFYEIIVIDQCEYIKMKNSLVLTHKANCKNHAKNNISVYMPTTNGIMQEKRSN